MYGPTDGQLAGAIGCLLLIGAALGAAALWIMTHLDVQVLWR